MQVGGVISPFIFKLAPGGVANAGVDITISVARLNSNFSYSHSFYKFKNINNTL